MHGAFRDRFRVWYSSGCGHSLVQLSEHLLRFAGVACQQSASHKYRKLIFEISMARFAVLPQQGITSKAKQKTADSGKRIGPVSCRAGSSQTNWATPQQQLGFNLIPPWGPQRNFSSSSSKSSNFGSSSRRSRSKRRRRRSRVGVGLGVG